MNYTALLLQNGKYHSAICHTLPNDKNNTINCLVCIESEIRMTLHVENSLPFYNKVTEDMSLHNGVSVHSINEVKNLEQFHLSLYISINCYIPNTLFSVDNNSFVLRGRKQSCTTCQFLLSHIKLHEHYMLVEYEYTKHLW